MKRKPAGQPNGGQFAPSAVPAPTAAPLVSKDGVNVYDQDGQSVDLNVLYEQFRAAENKAGESEDAYSEMLHADQKFKAAARAEEQGMVTKFYTVLDADANDLFAKRIQDEQDISFEEARELVDDDGADTKQEMLLNQYAIIRNHCDEGDRIEVEEALMDPARTDNSTRRAFANDASDEDLIFRLAEQAAAGDRSIQDGLSRNPAYQSLFS